GLGLGLAIVRRLAELLQTEVQVDSNPGSGSTFSFTLPTAQHMAGTETPTASVTTENYRQHLLGGRLILVIEDEAAIREAMRTLLSSWDCRVLLAEDLAGALAAIAQTDAIPDVIVADYRLRESLTGAEAIRAIEAQIGHRVPGVVITGDTAPERIREAQAAGYALLHKPVQAGKLRALLTHLTLDSTRHVRS
ncbi:MAG: response regulator, partial [Pseudomonadales bacterium]|nr:response regulator [Pseudomonadales bacterium]